MEYRKEGVFMGGEKKNTQELEFKWKQTSEAIVKQFVGQIADLCVLCFTNNKKEIFLFDTKIYSASASTLAMRALHITLMSQNSLSVDHTNGQLLSTLNDLHSLARRDAVSDLSTVLLVVHHQKLEVLHVRHGELVETVGKHVAGLGIRTVTNIGHQSSTTEATSAATINTLGLSPVLLKQITFQTRNIRSFS